MQFCLIILSRFLLKLYKAVFLILLLSTFVGTNIIPRDQQNGSSKTGRVVKVAVRAHSGVEAAVKKWSATIDYLSNTINGYIFQLAPLITFDEMRHVVETNEVEFVLTNPTAYIDLSVRYGVTRIATLLNGREGNGLSEFGGVVFVRSDRDDINMLSDVEGKSIMGVNREAFGGWQMAYRELLEIGIDPFEDCSEVLFSPTGTQETIVHEVIENKVDIGTVRTGILENMGKSGKIDLQNIKIIEPKTDDFPLLHTTRLYPEWAFSVLKKTDEALAGKVAIALLQMENNNPAAVKGGYTGWKVPLSYNRVLELLKILKVSPFEEYGKMSIIDFLKLYRYWFLTALLTVAGLILVVIYISGLNTKLNEARSKLEERIEKRTVELKQANVDLRVENERRKRTEKELYETEEKFRVLYNNSPDMYVSVSPDDAGILLCNETLLNKTGYSREEVIGAPIFKMYHEDCLDEVKKAFQQFVETGVIQDKELIIKRKDGGKIDVSLNVNAVRDEAGNILHSISSWRDITERKHAEEHIRHLQSVLRSIRNINQLIVHEKNRKKLLQRACEILKETSDYILVWIGLIQEDTKNVLPVGQSGFEDGYLKSIKITWDDSETGKGPTGTAIKTKKPFVMRDISADSRFAPWREEAMKRGYASSTAVPLIYGERIFGVLNVYASIPDAFNKEEVDLLLEASQDIAFAMYNIEIEEEIVRTKEFLQNVIDNTSDLICTVDLEGNFLSVNRAVTEKMGYDEEELIGKPKMTLAVEPELFLSAFKEVLEKGSLSNLEMSFRRKDGSTAEILFSVTLLKDKDNHPVAIAGFGKDITERKQAEEEIKRHIKELTTIYNAALKLQHLLTPDELAHELIDIMEQNLSYEFGAVLLIDESTGMLIPFALSDQGRGPEFLEADEDYILNQHITTGKGITGWVAQTGQSVRLGNVRVDPRYNALREDIRSELCVPLKAGNRVIGVLNVETTKPDAYTESDQRVLETIASQMALAIQQSYLHEQIQRYAAELEERVRERTAQLQAANNELEAFAYSVSHDLRAPLRGIYGFTEILFEDYTDNLDDEGRRICAVIKDNTHRMSQLIDDLLSFSRLSRKELQKSVIDMKAFVNSIYYEITTPEERKKIKLKINDLIDAFGDPTLIKQTWINLLSNAIKFSAKRKMAKINVSCKKEENRIVYCVKDNGAGFDMQYMNKLFGVFQRLHSEKEFPGTGVGLAIVQRIIHRHGGKVWAVGEVDKGASFYFSLPTEEYE